jgi:hypothetical protein
MKLILIVGWIATLVAAFALGRSILPSETPTTATRSLSDALGDRDYLARMYGVAKVLEGLGPENIDANLAVFQEEYSAMSDTEVRAFMIAWARFDPEAAFAWATGWQGFTKSKFAKIALWAWASIDPQGAVAAFSAMPAGKRDEQEIRMELIKGWVSSGDRQGATEYVLSFGGGRQNSMLVNKMALWISNEGIDSVIEWADAIPEEGDDSWAKKAAFQAAIGAVAKVDASRAAAWYEAHREFEYAEPSIKMLTFSWLTHGDPVTLFEWLQEQPAGQLRLETIRQTYRRWLKQDPDAAIAWLRGVTLTAALDPAVAIFARLESRMSPESAVEWANRIQDQKLQRMTIVPILRIWAKEDSAAAREWMVEQKYPASIRDDIIGRLPGEAAEQTQETDTATGATITAT